MICDRCNGTGEQTFDMEPGTSVITEECWKCQGSGRAVMRCDDLGADHVPTFTGVCAHCGHQQV